MKERGETGPGILFVVVFVFFASMVLILLMINTNGIEQRKEFWQNWCTSHLMIGDKDPVPLTTEQCIWMWDQKLVPQDYVAEQFYGEKATAAAATVPPQTTEKNKRKENEWQSKKQVKK